MSECVSRTPLSQSSFGEASNQGAIVSRLTIFIKGNLDVRDTLHALRLGGRVGWNGVNEILRSRAPALVARVRHETFSRSDALLAAEGGVPPVFAGRELALGAFPLASQFATGLFAADADAFVLSIQPDVQVGLLRHRRDGFLFYPDDWRAWSMADQAWLRANFEPAPALDVETSMANFAAIIARLRARSAAPILIYNLSAITPGEQVHVHQGLEDLLSTRIRRFNLGLIGLSQQTGVSIIDVDSIVAAGGATLMKLDTVHLTAAGARAVAEEVVRVLEDLAVLPASAGAPVAPQDVP